jgi:hypothetical protein
MSSAFSPLTPSRMLSKYMGKKGASSVNTVNDEPWKRAVAAQSKDVAQLPSTSKKVDSISWADIRAAIGAGDNSAEKKKVQKTVEKIKKNNGGSLPDFPQFETEYDQYMALKHK